MLFLFICTFYLINYIVYFVVYIISGDYTDEYRIGFRHEVWSAEDTKSEMIKLFQEAWEREQGSFFMSDLPPYTKYAEDILRQQR